MSRDHEHESPPELDAATASKLGRLRARLRELGSVLVCFSGGVDSAFLLAVARQELGERVVAMTAVSPSLGDGEQRDAEAAARAIGADLRLVASGEMDDPRYVANQPDRCLYCKRELYRIAVAKAAEWRLAHVANGTNADDHGDYRPGNEAAAPAGVLSPLAETGFGKQEIRAAARSLGLPSWDKPASACLASRLPYGTSVTRERLASIAGLEQVLRGELGFRQVRVRYHDVIARIEVEPGELSRAAEPAVRARIVEAGREHGFTYVTLDLGGYRVGSHNELLPGRSLPVLSGRATGR